MSDRNTACATSRMASAVTREIARQHSVDQPRVVEQRRVHRETIGALLDALEGAQLVGLGESLRPGQLVVAHELGGQPFQLFVESRLDALDRDTRPDGRPPRAHGRAARRSRA